MALPLFRKLALFALAAAGLMFGIGAWWLGEDRIAAWIWAAGSLPTLAVLLLHIVQAIRRGEAGLDIIAVLALSGTLALGEPLTSAVIALMVSSGQLLEGWAAARAQREMTALLDRAPRQANRCEADGQIVTIPLDDVKANDRLLVRAGDVLPVDGTLAAGVAVLDEAALTGEPLPTRHEAGGRLRSGATNVGDAFELIAVTTAADSAYAGIIRLVQAAQTSKAPASRLADRYALLFVPLALLVAGLAWLLSGDPNRALAVLVVATPCPLILAVPVAIVSGMSRCAKRGVLVKGAGALETLATVKTLLFDKTGTLTGGRARVVALEIGDDGKDANGQGGAIDPSEMLRLAASLDQASQHVLAEAIIAAAQARGLSLSAPTAVHEQPGAGLTGQVDGRRVSVGSVAYVEEQAPAPQPPPWRARFLRRMGYEGAAGVFVAVDGDMIGAILLADEIRPEAARSLRLLRKAGAERLVMVTGDRSDVAETIGAALGLDDVIADCTPADKVAAVEAAKRLGPTLMVGDGVNDAPALALADVGVAMGARGAAASSESADVVLLVDRLDRLAEAMRIARRSCRIAVESVLVGMGLSFVAMGVAAAGFLPPLSGAVLQEIIDVAVIANALRALGDGRFGRKADAFPAGEAAGLKAEHDALLPLLDRIRATGDRLSAGQTAPTKQDLADLATHLRDELLRHEQEDDRALYPKVARLIGGADPMAAMSRGHREIGQLVRRYGRMVADLPDDAPDDPAALHETQRVLYSLDAILRLHFAQEEEIYHALADAA
ncbi:heavy metal translocating P-type ATPase [Azospirillum cavernae]|uniref:P-type Zn(2+) transporter n=1 Tax=Azospirillum cavernae TaxID=2320860 RepID=A0A418VSJ3_9PROT|nr:heavy metal translocating P-type ATPase [Azospirillum cavernae]RJF79453.1 heavy metal translocating P-type ATPase [Azospirillum cavernae]